MAYQRVYGGGGGGRPGGPINIFGPMTPTVMALLLVNVFMFMVTFFGRGLLGWLALIPSAVFPGAQVWRLGTYMFLHADFAHILFNMLVLWWFGSPLEQVFGRSRFLWFYFVTGVGAGVVCVPFYIVAGASHIPIVGASGALFGILMAFALLYPNARVFLWFVLPIKVKYLVIAFVVLEYMATVSYLGGDSRSNVASVAHLSGMLIAYFYLRGLMDIRAGLRRLRSGRSRRRKFEVIRDDEDRGPWLH